MDTLKDHALLVEMYKNEERYFRINTEFRPIIRPKFQGVSKKFYAKHDMDGEVEINEDILNDIKKKSMLGPKEMYDNPVTESQEVGWYLDPLVAIDRSNRILFHFRRESPMTKFGDKIFKKK